MKLFTLNFLRALKENFFSWFVLGSIYLLSASQLLQPIFEWALKRELPGTWMFVGVALLILSAGLLASLFERVFGAKFALPLRIPRRLSHYLWFTHMSRRAATWIVVAITVGLGIWLEQKNLFFFWLLAAQLMNQIHMFAADRWRAFFCFNLGRTAALNLVHEFVGSHVFFGVVVYALLYFFWPTHEWLKWLLPTVSALWGASVVVLEGDSGKPLLVNSVSLVLGTLCGLIVFMEPGFIVLVAWACLRIPELSHNRFWSVENADQDAVLW